MANGQPVANEAQGLQRNVDCALSLVSDQHMSFLSSLTDASHKVFNPGPIGRGTLGKFDIANDVFGSKPGPPPPPGVPNPNDAANAAQSTTDAMRMRRGLLANIYAGGQNTPPVSGKTQLGT